MSRFILLAGVAGLYAAGCSSPDDGGVEDPPSAPPPGFLNGTLGQGGAPGQQVGQAGTGTDAPVTPTAGTGGAPPTPAAGAGGTPVAAAGASGTAGAPSTIPTGTGNLIMHDGTGWVAGNTNALGIQGSFYTFGDYTGNPPGDTELTVDDLTTPTRVCVSGTASAVIDANYEQYWGGGLALNLADPGNMMPPALWSPGSVTGFSFTVTGPTIPPNIRFLASVSDNGPAYCQEDIPTAGPVTIQFDPMVTECWGGPNSQDYPPGTAFRSIQWQVVTVLDQPTPFDFCIENLTAITAP